MPDVPEASCREIVEEKEEYAAVITWIRTGLSFEILKSVHLCTRGSRSPFRVNNEHIDEFKLNSVIADVNSGTVSFIDNSSARTCIFF